MDDISTQSIFTRPRQQRSRGLTSVRSGVILAGCLAVVGMMLPATEGTALAQTAKPKAVQSTAQNNPTSKQVASAKGVDDAALRTKGPRSRHKSNTSLKLEPKDMADALEVLHDFNPELAQKLGDWLKEHPQNARTELSRRVPWIVRLVRLRRSDPPAYQLAIADLRDYARTNELAKQLRAAQNAKDKDQPRIDALTLALKKLLAEHFDLRQKIRARDIQKLQDRVTQLRKQMDQRLASRDRILEARFKQLTRTRKSGGKGAKSSKGAKGTKKTGRTQSKSQ